MKSRDRNIGIRKIASSHLLLVILLLASFYFIGKEIILLTSPNPYEAELMGKRKAINRTLNCLYQTDALGQTLIMGKQADFAQYEQALSSTLAALDTLKQITADSVQIYRIERVDTLLQQKSRNVLALLKTINSRQNIEIYEKNIDKIIAQQDSMLQRQHEQYRILQKQDSLLKKQKSQKLIKRIASAFGNKGSRTDTEENDSIGKYTPIDSVVTISQNLKTEIDDSRENLSEKISVQSDRLWHNNQVLNSQIDHLIRDYEQEELSAFILAMEKQQTIRRRAVYVLGIIAIIAIVLALAFLFVISRDLTRSHRYRKELEEANRTAGELLRSREKLMLTITHDFKAPLSSVIGYIDLLERLLQDERQRFYLQNMKQSSQHLQSLVSNLLDFYRLDARKTDIQYIPFVPACLFEEIKNRFVPIAEQKGLQLHYRTDCRTEQTFTGDPLRITQIANNLLSNAIKFTAQGN
ncbi:MAG: hypothetical protein J1E02_08610, partial [Coprobacter sp.]|nr:hypothetical protein [Coprobacter sp.]